MTATEPCVSLTTGTLSPDQRVNYAYGMVLGLDEFLQEQLYQQEKDRLHRRVLHGYGTSYGLNLTTQQTTDGTSDFTLSVSPGVGIDQWGREFVIRDAQCVRLGSWLVAQERANPGIVAQHGNGSGDARAYVVARYASCLDNLVPLPGQACSSGEQTQVASRIRDAWEIELRWEPPSMPRWDSDRRLGRLLASVDIVDTPDPDVPGENALFDAVRALADLAQDGPGDLDEPSGAEPVVYQIARTFAFQTWQEILAVWVSEVRPQLEPELITPPESSDPAILLGAVNFSTRVWPPFDPDNPVVSSAESVVAGRPYVLNTQLIQQLAPPVDTVTEPTELVTLVPSLSTKGVLTIQAWFHVMWPVTLTAPIQVVSEGFVYSFAVSPKNPEEPNSAQVWTLTSPSGNTFTAGQKVTATFESDSVLVNSNHQGTVHSYNLNEWRDKGARFLNPGPFTGTVTAYTTVPAPTTGASLVGSTQAEDPQPQPSASVTGAQVPGAPIADAEFVTITDTVSTDQQLSFELWFHPQPRGAEDNMTVETPQVRAFDEITGNPLTVTGLTQDPLLGNAWTVTTDVPSGKRPFPAYVRFVFPTEGFVLAGATSGTTGLADWIDSAAIGFVGWDQGESSIVAFHRVAAQSGGGSAPKATAAKTTAAKATTAKATRSRAAATGRSRTR